MKEYNKKQKEKDMKHIEQKEMNIVENYMQLMKNLERIG